MPEPLPHFRYHPDPLASGVIAESSETCRCCGHKRGYIYSGPVYAKEELRATLCPWCIADGSAAARFDALFADDHPLARAGLSDDIIGEVTRRTPGYFSWQQDEWLIHCGDACAFDGEATAADLAAVSMQTKQECQSHYNLTDDDWDDLTRGYEVGGEVGFYRFTCRHCGLALLGWDCS
jgi:uncharacterized protein CbrC (UPF0167 family)